MILNRIDTSPNSGFSLIELLVAITLVGIITLIAWNRLSRLYPHYQLDGAARNLVAELAKTRGRAIAEGRCFMVVFDGTAKTFQKQSKAGAANCGTTGFAADPTDGVARQLDSSGNIAVSASANPVFGTRGGVSTTAVVTLTNSLGISKVLTVTSTGRVNVQ